MSYLYKRTEELIYFTMTCAIFNILFTMRGTMILNKNKKNQYWKSVTLGFLFL